jgi:putative ABC transport system permease protein
MSYSLTTLWHDRQRYLPGVVGVAFSALLIAMQFGLLLGIFEITSIPVDHTRADIWMGSPSVLSVDLGRPIREGYLARLASRPEVERTEVYLQGFAYWSKKKGDQRGGMELCMVIGSRLGDDSLGAVDFLTREKRAKLTEPGAIIMDESDKEKLGVSKVGDTAEVSGTRVKVVDFTQGVRSLAGPYVFCSIDTARPMLRLSGDQVTYVLAKCRNKEDAPKVAKRLQEKYEDKASVMTKEEFSLRTRMHWLKRTKGGSALGFAALLALLVGAVVTCQTMYAATAASLREFAVLQALGIPRWRMKALVISQSFWVGVAGITLGVLAFNGLAEAANQLVPVRRDWWLQVPAAAVTMVVALFSGLFALRSLRKVEPATLLR